MDQPRWKDTPSSSNVDADEEEKDEKDEKEEEEEEDDNGEDDDYDGDDKNHNVVFDSLQKQILQ